MPTWRGMPVVQRALAARVLSVAFAAGLAFQALAPAAAYSAPPSSTAPPTTAPARKPAAPPPAKDSTPAPPAFTLPLDVGTKLVHDGQVARFELAYYGPRLGKAKARTAEVQGRMNI